MTLGVGCRHDFLSVLEPYMMEEKRGMVDFLHTAVACFRDLPRGHIINLAQHLQQACLHKLSYLWIISAAGF